MVLWFKKDDTVSINTNVQNAYANKDVVPSEALQLQGAALNDYFNSITKANLNVSPKRNE